MISVFLFLNNKLLPGVLQSIVLTQVKVSLHQQKHVLLERRSAELESPPSLVVTILPLKKKTELVPCKHRKRH